MLLHVQHDARGDLAGIKILRAVFGDAAVGVRHVVVAQQRAHSVGAIVMRVDFPRGGKAGDHADVGGTAGLRGLVPEFADMRAHQEAVLAIGDGRLQQFRQAARAPAAQRDVECAQRHRRGDRLVADFVHPALQNEAPAVVGLALDQVGPHVRPHRQRCAAVEIQRGVHVLLRQVHMQAAHAGDAAHLRIDRGLHQRGTDRRIDHIAAGTQDVGTGFRRFRLRRRNHRGHGRVLRIAAGPGCRRARCCASDSRRRLWQVAGSVQQPATAWAEAPMTKPP